MRDVIIWTKIVLRNIDLSYKLILNHVVDYTFVAINDHKLI